MEVRVRIPKVLFVSACLLMVGTPSLYAIKEDGAPEPDGVSLSRASSQPQEDFLARLANKPPEELTDDDLFSLQQVADAVPRGAIEAVKHAEDKVKAAEHQLSQLQKRKARLEELLTHPREGILARSLHVERYAPHIQERIAYLDGCVASIDKELTQLALSFGTSKEEPLSPSILEAAQRAVVAHGILDEVEALQKAKAHDFKEDPSTEEEEDEDWEAIVAAFGRAHRLEGSSSD